MRVTIRRATCADCDPLLGLIADHARFERSTATLTRHDLLTVLESEAPPVILFVGAQGDDLIGFAALTFDFAVWRARRWAHLDCLFVQEGNRGSGVGDRLLRAAAHHAWTSGADRLEWQTPSWNKRAIGFYRRAGAVPASKIRFTLVP